MKPATRRQMANDFMEVRSRLSRYWGKRQIDFWLQLKHPHLGMKSPAHTIHAGDAHRVHVLIDALEKQHG